MQYSQWIAKARNNWDELVDLILRHHPASKSYTKTDAKITAPGAESACQTIRDDITFNHNTVTIDQLNELNAMLDTDEGVASLLTLLQGAWFGVPESTDCWSIPGFAVAVELLEDPPE